MHADVLFVQQVVPEAVRTSVYAFDKCIIGALGAVTTPLAGLLAEKVFGFVHVSTHKAKHASGGSVSLILFFVIEWKMKDVWCRQGCLCRNKICLHAN